MPDLSAWLNYNGDQIADSWVAEADRGAGISFMLGRHGVSVVLYRNGTARVAQTMMVNPGGRNTTTDAVRGGAGTAGGDELGILGTTDLDIERGDTFALNADYQNYRVTFVVRTFAGMVQARAEVLDNA